MKSWLLGYRGSWLRGFLSLRSHLIVVRGLLKPDTEGIITLLAQTRGQKAHNISDVIVELVLFISILNGVLHVYRFPEHMEDRH